MTPAGHEVEYIEIPDLSQLDALPRSFDLVAISSYSAQIDEAYELARRFRQAGVPTVMGGLHVTARPEEAASYCDAVVIGEGEPWWLDVLSDAECGTLRPYYGPAERGYDLAASPIPAFHLLDISRYNRLTVQTSLIKDRPQGWGRGCYCTSQ